MISDQLVGALEEREKLLEAALLPLVSLLQKIDPQKVAQYIETGKARDVCDQINQAIGDTFYPDTLTFVFTGKVSREAGGAISLALLDFEFSHLELFVFLSIELKPKLGKVHLRHISIQECAVAPENLTGFLAVALSRTSRSSQNRITFH